MIRPIFCLLILIATQGQAEVTKLSPAHRKILEDGTGFRELRTTTALPKEVVALCVDYNGRIAEPGGKWEATDLIYDNTLPQSRLIWAAHRDDYYVIHYEKGGRGHSLHVLIATYKPGDSKATLVWHGVAYKDIRNYTAFLTALKDNTLDDTRDYAH
jgi:hypothetical protein